MLDSKMAVGCNKGQVTHRFLNKGLHMEKGVRSLIEV